MWFRSQRFALALPEEGEIYDVLRFLALVEPLVMADGIGGDDQPADFPLGESNLHVVFSVKQGAVQI